MAIDVAEIERIIHVADGLPPTFDSLYDREADVLYITFGAGESDRSDFTDDDVVLRYRDGRLISVTLLHASKRGLHLDDG